MFLIVVYTHALESLVPLVVVDLIKRNLIWMESGSTIIPRTRWFVEALRWLWGIHRINHFDSCLPKSDHVTIAR
jgi:hypothetical protein